MVWCGVPSAGTAQAIGIIRKIQEEARYRSKNIYAIFIDLEKAFDSVPRKVLWDCLQGIGVQGHMLNVIMKFYENFTGSIGKEAFQRSATGLRTRTTIIQSCL